MSGTKITDIISEIRSWRLNYPCMSCAERNLVMPFLVEGQVNYLCRECINRVYDSKGFDEKKRALPFCVFCENHHSRIVSITFDKKRKIWQVWKLVKPDYNRKLLSEHQSFGDFLLEKFRESCHLSIHKDITKKNNFTVFVSKKEDKK